VQRHAVPQPQIVCFTDAGAGVAGSACGDVHVAGLLVRLPARFRELEAFCQVGARTSVVFVTAALQQADCRRFILWRAFARQLQETKMSTGVGLTAATGALNGTRSVGQVLSCPAARLESLAIRQASHYLAVVASKAEHLRGALFAH